MKWFLLIGNVVFTIACGWVTVAYPETAAMTAPTGVLSAFTAFVVWSECRGEWLTRQ